MAVRGRSEQIKWHVINYAKKRIKTAQVSLSTLFQSLQRYFRDPGFDQNTVRDSGNATYFDGKRDSSKFGHEMREFFPVCREFGLTDGKCKSNRRSRTRQWWRYFLRHYFLGVQIVGAAQRIVSMQEKAPRGWGVGREGDETLLSPSSFLPPFPLRFVMLRCGKHFFFAMALKFT